MGLVRFLVQATGADYFARVRELVASFRYFRFKRQVRVYTDQAGTCEGADVIPCPPARDAWPKLGLIGEQEGQLAGVDLVVMVDADMRLVAPIRRGELEPNESGLFAVSHFLYPRLHHNQPSPRCAAHVPEGERPPVYWQSCLFGGRPGAMLALAGATVSRIEKSRSREGAWEEPFLNWYWAQLWSLGRPIRTLGVEYACPSEHPHFPGQWQESYELAAEGRAPKILHRNAGPWTN